MPDPLLKISDDGKKFYRSLFVIVGPIALQNLITAAVSSADVIMLGFVGQTALAAASLAGQIQFVLMLFFTGISSGLIMLTSQYWGKRDTYSIETLAGIAFRLSCTAGLLFGSAAFFCPRLLMKIFTNDEALIDAGAQYLKFVSFSYFFMSVSQVFQGVLKSIEHVRIVTVMTFLALGLNILLNACFIFGFLFIPRMGIRGVALATSIARAVELALCIIVSFRIKDIRMRPSILLRKNSMLRRDFFHFSLPALGNEFVWGAAFAMYSVILGHKGEDIVAANSVTGVARNLGSVLCFGMAYGGAILLGKEMGGGSLEHAEKDASRLWKITVLAGILGGIVILLLRPLMYKVAVLTPEASRDMELLLYINSVSLAGAAVNTVLICGIFRAGGDARFGFILDSVIMWCVSVPLGLIAAFVLDLPPVTVYLVLYLDEFEKMPFVIHHYRKGSWLRNITRDFSRNE
jgi:putative MATE family efflux protein